MATFRQAYERMSKAAQERLVFELTRLGKDAMHYAFNRGFMNKTNPNGNVVWSDRSGDLRASFGSAVYVDGKIQEDTIRFLDNSGSGEGRTAARAYLMSCHPRAGKKEVSIIVVAAMPYTKYLEKGTYILGGRGRDRSKYNPTHYKIKVVSSARDYINRNYEQYVNNVYKSMKIKKPVFRIVKTVDLDNERMHDLMLKYEQ
jgi:hypothetical protein